MNYAHQVGGGDEPNLLLAGLDSNRVGVFVGFDGYPGQKSNINFPQTPAVVGE